MQLPLQITFRHMESSEALEAAIRSHTEELEQYFSPITSCRVVVEPQHKHKHHGNLYDVRIDITVAGKELVVHSKHDADHAHEDVYVALRDSFDAMIRQLDNLNRKQQGQVKHHETPPHGRIIELIPEMDYGRIENSDGREIYFHRNSVLNVGFDTLELGDEVRFAIEDGEDGPQASSVSLVGKHHILG